jgi:hypothetical protein
MNLSQVRYKLSQYNVFHNVGDVQYVWNTYSDEVCQGGKCKKIKKFTALFRAW